MRDLYKEVFQDINDLVSLYGDTNCCASIAVSLTTLTPFNEVYEYVMSKGRKKRGFTSHDLLEEAIERFSGKDIDYKTIEEVFGRKTIPVSKIGNYLPKGSYICYTRGHVLSLIDGNVIDWTEGRRHRVQYYYKISD